MRKTSHLQKHMDEVNSMVSKVRLVGVNIDEKENIAICLHHICGTDCLGSSPILEISVLMQ